MSATRRQIAIGLVRMSRPPQLLLVATVYTLGAAMAGARGGGVNEPAYVAGLVVLIPVAASIHYANEYADHETDRLTTRTPFSGGSGALVDLPLSRGLPRVAGWTTLVVGLGGAAVCLRHGLSPTAIGILVLGGVGGWQYSRPPLKLAWHGFGELENAILGGMILALYGFAVQSGYVDGLAVGAMVPFTLVVFLNLLDTTWPDREADAAVGKRTLATRWPTQWLRWLYGVVAVSAVAILLSATNSWLPPTVTIASLAAMPFVGWGWVQYTNTRSPFPTVAGMVVMAVAQLFAWLGLV